MVALTNGHQLKLIREPEPETLPMIEAVSMKVGAPLPATMAVPPKKGWEHVELEDAVVRVRGMIESKSHWILASICGDGPVERVKQALMSSYLEQQMEALDSRSRTDGLTPIGYAKALFTSFILPVHKFGWAVDVLCLNRTTCPIWMLIRALDAGRPLEEHGAPPSSDPPGFLVIPMVSRGDVVPGLVEFLAWRFGIVRETGELVPDAEFTIPDE